MRIELFGDEIERITRFDPLTGELLGELDELVVFPATHYVAGDERMRARDRRDRGRARRAPAASSRATASCSRPSGSGCAPSTTSRCSRGRATATGSRTTAATSTGAAPGEPPYTLLDYFPDDWLLVVDESHVTVPQLHGQYDGDRSRKEVLVEHGFRLPSALDNRPLRFEEFEARINQAIFMSATPVALRARGLEPGRRADRPADRPGRPRGRREADEAPDRRPDRRDRRRSSHAASASSSRR